MRRSLLLLLPVVLLVLPAVAQDLSGSWEGSEEGNFLRIVLLKAGNRYVGYAYDVDPSGGYCRTNFSATYNPSKKEFTGVCESMIVNRGNHVLALYLLHFAAGRNEERLDGVVRDKNQSLFDRMGWNDGPVELRRVTRRVDTTAYMRDAVAKLRPPNPPTLVRATQKPPPVAVAPKKPAPKKVTPKAPVASRLVPVRAIRKDSITTVAVPKPLAAPQTIPVTAAAPPVQGSLLALRDKRNSILLQEITTSEPVIIIRVFDNGVPDGDTISILHNNSVLADHKPVAVRSTVYTVRLDDGNDLHEITLIAHNTGSIPPNTASIVIEAGEARYRLTASTDLGRNALIRIHYRK